MTSRVLSLACSDEWTRVLRRCGRYDTYHLPRYHALAARQERGVARLLVVEEAGHICALPFVVREVAGLPWMAASNHRDAVSVYGYAGPVCSTSAPDANLARAFQQAVLEHLEAERIVSMFCRLHPLIASEWLLDGLGDVSSRGVTVSMQLTGAGDGNALRQQMSHNRRREIRLIREAGIVVEEDRDFHALDAFIAAYYETMRRNGAGAGYLFARDYFEDLSAALGQGLRLFLARSREGDIVGAILVFACGDILQYHLSATPDRFVPLSAVKLIIDEVAAWGARHGYRWFHLGGGLSGSVEDGVYRFKRGFSNTTHPFKTFSLVVAHDVYQDLCERRRRWPGARPGAARSGFFPEYRDPSPFS